MKFKRIVSLARKRSHNKEKDQQLLQEFLPKFAITESDFKSDNISMEIGFGSGENILALARNNPEITYFACEVFTGGVVTLIRDMLEQEINNIRIWYDDALELITDMPDNFLNNIYILHPDPWPKVRHHKRRLINIEFLKILMSKMKPSANLLMVTDHENYAEHIEVCCKMSDDLFERKFSDYPEIVKTKYRLKADAQGIESHYFYLVKR